MNRNRNRSTIEAVQTYRIEKHHVQFFSYIRTEFYKSLYTLMFWSLSIIWLSSLSITLLRTNNKDLHY